MAERTKRGHGRMSRQHPTGDSIYQQPWLGSREGEQAGDARGAAAACEPGRSRVHMHIEEQQVGEGINERRYHEE